MSALLFFACPVFFVVLFLLLVLQLERDRIGAKVPKQHTYF